jgi:hypothetical protein
MFKKLFGWTKKTASSRNSKTAGLAIDLEMNYCPGCDDEYRADIKRCVSCDINLISGVEKLEKLRLKELEFNGRSMNITTQDERVVIRTGKLRDLKQLQILLARERVPTIISGESASCGKG